MDANLVALIINLLSQGLWQLGVNVYSAFDDIYEDAPLQAALHRAAEEVGELVPSNQRASAQQVLRSAETLAIVRALYLHKLSDEGIVPDQARSAFVKHWSRLGGDRLDVPAEAVFDGLVAACDAVLDVAVAEGSVGALDTKAAIRHKLLAEQLSAIEAQLQTLIDAGDPTEEAIVRFETEIREEVASRTSEVTPPDFAGAPRVPLDELYVAPNLETGSEIEGTSKAYHEWLANVQREVILGNPGAGKSTLAAKLCNDLATGYGRGIASGRDFTPFVVVLREFGADKKVRPLSIARYIAEQLHVRFQLDHKPEIVEYLMFAGRMLVVFDGLDELLETSYRSEIRKDVESFARRYPNCPIVVTSREVGYEAAPLSERLFTLSTIQDFDDEQVGEYAYKWFRLEPELTDEECSNRVTDFVRESAAVSDLRNNPLMLALMCNLYRGQNYIPRNRPDVYDKCSRMLFEVRDRQRGIVEELPIEEHVEPAMHHLAGWIYADPQRQKGVTEEELIEEAGRFLLEYRFDQDEFYQAQHAAREFIKFCQGRAWVFTDTGTDEDGEPLYQFTHRTFLEYFTARQVVSTVTDSKELARTLVARVARGEADVVAQLALQIRAKSSLGSADVMLGEVIDAATDAGPEDQARILGFGATCLQFLVPKSSTTRQLARSIVDLVLSQKPEEIAKLAVAAYLELLRSSARNRDAISNELASTLGTELETGSHRAAELMYTTSLPYSFRGSVGDAAHTAYWEATFDDLRAEHSDRMRAARETKFTVAYEAWLAGDMSTQEIVDVYELRALFWPVHGRIFHPRPRKLPSPNLADRIIARARRSADGIDELAQRLLSTQTPWASLEDFRWSIMQNARAPGSGKALNGSALFVATCLMAAYLEARDQRRPFRGEQSLSNPHGRPSSRYALVDPTLDLLSHRLEGDGSGDLPMVSSLISDPEQRDFLTSWTAGEISFVGPPPEPPRS